MDDDADALYGLPHADFTAARDALAKRLRAAGDRSGADEVKALRRPTAPAWALNLAAREAADEVRAVLEAGDVLRGAHEALTEGKGDVRALRRATDEERAAARALGATAARLAAEAGAPLSPAARDRVRETIHAAALDPEAREALASGRLEREREAASAEGLFGATTTLAESGGAKKGAAPAKRSGRAKSSMATKASTPAKASTPPRSSTSKAPKPSKRAGTGASGGPSKAEREQSPRVLAAAERELRKVEGGAQAARIRLENAEVAEHEARSRLERATATLDDARRRCETAQTELRAAKTAVAEAHEHADP